MSKMKSADTLFSDVNVISKLLPSSYSIKTVDILITLKTTPLPSFNALGVGVVDVYEHYHLYLQSVVWN